jgi:hypothetical protein
MKQGRADKSGIESRKRDPIPHKVHESAVAQLGLSVQFEKKPLQAGEGYRGSNVTPARAGPGGGREIHPHGSQGKHK